MAFFFVCWKNTKGPISLAWPETRWRPGGDSSLRDVSWRLAGSPGSSGKFKYVRFFETFSSLQHVSQTSPRRLHQLRRRRGDYGRRLRRRCGVDAATSSRRCLTHFRDCRRRRRDIAATAGDVAETSPQLRRRRGDVPATSGRIGCHLVWRRLRDVALVRAQAIFWSPASPELPRLISRGSRGDVSANEIGP